MARPLGGLLHPSFGAMLSLTRQTITRSACICCLENVAMDVLPHPDISWHAQLLGTFKERT